MKENNKISIARALTELKVSNNKIVSAIDNGLFVTSYKGDNDITSCYLSRNDAEMKILSSVQSITDLIEHRSNIKRLIVMSNAITKVSVNDVEYTVAEAIEKKDSIKYEQLFVRGLKAHYASITTEIDNKNDYMEESLKELLKDLAGSEKNELTIQSTTKAYKEVNEMKLLDPAGIEKLIEKLENSIESFLLDVDVVLSESNATTFIEV